MRLPYNIKAQRDAIRMQNASMSYIEGAGEKGSKPRPFSHEAAVAQFRSWCYVAASLNANAVASVPLRLYTRKRSGAKCLFQTRPVSRHRKAWLAGDLRNTPHTSTMRKMMEMGDYEEVIESHPLTDLLAKVNPFYNGFDFTVLRMLWQELTGNAYMMLVQPGDGMPPSELWPLPPQWTWIIPSKETWVQGYLYGKEPTKRVTFTADEVIHFRRPNPKDQFYGLGKVEAAWGAVSINDSNHEMDLALADNHARPDYLVVVQDAVPDQLDRFDAQIRSKLRGTRKSGTFLSVNGKVDVKPLNFPPKDLVGRDDVVEEIAAVFGVPVSMMKANDPNLASAETGYASWREMTILPMCRSDEEQLNQSLVPLFSDDLCLAYDNPVPTNEAAQFDRRTRYVSGGIITVNEARVDDGYEPMDDPNADKLLINGQPLGGMSFDFGALGGAMDEDQVTSTEEAEDAEPAAPVASAEDAEVTAPGAAQEIQTTEATVLNGAQISSAKDIVLAVVAGELPRDSGVAMLEAFFNLTPEKAEAIMGSAGRSNVATTPNPVPSSGQATPSPAPAMEDDEEDEDEDKTLLIEHSHKSFMMGCGSLGCECHDVQPTMEKSWDTYRTKASADDTVREEPENPLVAFSSAMGKIFAKQRDDVIRIIGDANLTKKADSPEELRAQLVEALAAYNDEMDRAIKPFITRMAQVGGNVGLATVNQMRPDAVAGVFDVQNPRVQEFLDGYTVKLRDEVQGYTGEAISQTVKTQLNEGRTTADIAAAMREDASLGGGSLSPARSEAIARTESARAYVEGERKAWEDSGVVEGKEWLLAPDACEFCQAVAKQFNGKKVGLNDPFFKKGSTLTVGGATMKLDYTDVQGPPLHPNDRCDLVPVLEDFT